MELLKEIWDKNSLDKNFTKREASRAVIFDENDMIPILFVSKNNYHKLPWGWIESGEDKKTALGRELLEEVWCKATITGEVGKVIEYRAKYNQEQTSYYFIWKVTEKWEPTFSEIELNQWFQIKRMTLDQAISTLKSDIPESYTGKFIQQRDLTLLKKVKEIKK